MAEIGMRERIARALLDSVTQSDKAQNVSALQFVSNRSDIMANAVLAAMRTPTEAMVNAGSDSIDGFERLENRPHAYAIEAQGTWKAMIDAAIA